ncbi:predicted protein [Nematostella vectensis]|uniref:Uncharacterized protein n=1 Tax=Nematostella vectensis TaxID=45351 RepID=A7RTY0_NEMVE|nr:predicted protein [Nematostella vectensis]|eukprot:XP_001637173.1 predicted protein [Nematostella vectensis]
MEVHRSLVVVVLLVVQYIGLVLFLKGFFPIKQAIPGSASLSSFPPEPGSDAPGSPVDAVLDRLVIVLIDALRADFVLPGDGRMKYLNELVRNNESLSFLAKAHPPTVTMPRIKALMTGGIPGFIDVLLNSLSTELQEDNLLAQLTAAGKKIVFFGDDTWIKLFPGNFMRSDGTNSFFVSDYTEVDDNVTRHLGKELSSKDWDVMILHYLGLDHIGHLAGPSSPLIGPKLQEMDDILRDIHRNLIHWDQEMGTHSAIVLCGDHGMSDSGSHGGASLPETLTPLVFLSSRLKDGRG